MVEHCPFKAGVLGSNPSRLTACFPPLGKVRHSSYCRKILFQWRERPVLERRGSLEPIAQLVDRLEHVAIVNLARAGLVASGDVADVKMSDAVDIRADVFDQIPFHDLDVVDVEKE